MLIKGRVSLSRDYLIVTFLIALFVLASALVAGIFSTISFNEEKKEYLKSSSDRIEDSVHESFNYVQNLLEFIGRQIVESKDLRPENINKLVRTELTTDPDFQRLFSWTSFNWIDNNDKLYSSERNGKIVSIINFKAKRSYLTETRKLPWRLHFSKPDFGVPTNQWVLPSGFGINKLNGDFIGTIGLGFSIASLKKKIEKEFLSEHIKFVILDDHGKIIVSSSSDFHHKEKEFLDYLNIKKSSGDLKGFFKEKKLGITRHYFTSIKDLPFTLLLWYDTAIYRDLVLSILANISGFIIAGLALLSIFIIYRGLLVGPIVELADSAIKIRSGEDKLKNTNYKINEFNVLAQSLKMVKTYVRDLIQTKDELKKSYDSLEYMNESLENKVRERTIELENALKIKTDILNNISHEVRTPIHGVTAISQGLIDAWDELSEKQRKNYALDVAKSASRLSNLSNNILDLSKVSSGKMEYDIKPNDLKDVVEEIIDECILLYVGAKKINLRFKISRSAKTKTLFDKNKILQVLRNLYANSIKFTSQGEIIAKISNQNNKIIFEISDEGIGLNNEELEKIFEPFYQNVDSKKFTSGTGLGLAISKEIIQGHKGEIWAEACKKGAKLLFSLPILNSAENVSDKNKKNVTEAKKGKVNIVIIDDEEIAHKGLELILSGIECNVIKFQTGVEGENFIIENADKLDYLFLDIMLPDKSGMDILTSFINKKLNTKIKIIVQSGNYVSEESKELMKRNNVDFITKPYNKESVMKSLGVIS